MLSRKVWKIIMGLVLLVAVVFVGREITGRLAVSRHDGVGKTVKEGLTSSDESGVSGSTSKRIFLSRQTIDASGLTFVRERLKPWKADASLAEIAKVWEHPGRDVIQEADQKLAEDNLSADFSAFLRMVQASCRVYEGDPKQAFDDLARLRLEMEKNQTVAEKYLYTVIYLQAVTSLRRGETENCVKCRGEGSCILPLSPSAKHTDQSGSRLAIKYFTEYLDKFPEDLEVRWLLNVAHMTLGQYPEGVDSKYRISLAQYERSEFSIGKFRDVGHLVGINCLNMAGGAILDDFDNDGLLDLVFTTADPTQTMAYFRNKGDGTFGDRTKEAGLSDQLGGLNCVQADFNNDGFLDIFIPRGAWLTTPMRPSLLKNNGNNTFTDVTADAGLMHPMNTDTCQWADFDNDGWLDLFVCGEAQPSRLYRNKGNGTFEDATSTAGLDDIPGMWKGCSWFDYDGDRFPDLFLNNLTGAPKLFHNNRDGTLSDVTLEKGIDAPTVGLSCWTWDYDNDGWLDICATSFDRSLTDMVKGLLGEPHQRKPGKLYRNLGGKEFEDVAQEVGLDECYSSMGSNFGDFDNDGFLDIYLGTGDHDVATLVPNRLIRNLGGKKFVDISASSGTGHLQKGHGIGCGDWNRDGNLDIAIEMGGAIPGDRYHNVLFLNPGQGNHWLNVKLVGKKSNTSAIGARIKAVTSGENPQTIYRTVCSGSSFGANPLEQMVGLGKAEQIAELEIYWPTSDTTQVFRDIPADQAIEITEFAADFKKREYKPIPLPKE